MMNRIIQIRADLRGITPPDHQRTICRYQQKSLDVYLQERAPIDLDQLAKLADQYLLAHGSVRMARIKQM